MSRLARFEHYRYLGVRDTMKVYDCDAQDQFIELTQRLSDEDLVARKMIQAFSPDTILEAANRGFRPAGAGQTSSP